MVKSRMEAALAGFVALAVLSTAQAAWSIQNGLRWHSQIQLPGGITVTTSSINRSLGQDSQNQVVSLHKIFLMDGGPAYGRWVVESQESGSSDFLHLQGHCTITLKDTGEQLNITYLTSAGEGQGTFHLSLAGKHMDVSESGLATSAASTRAFLAVASPLFSKGLGVIIQLAQSRLDLALSPIPFQPLTGVKAVPGGGPSSLTAKGLPVDCSFDASFGYPCLPGEHSAANGMLYVVSLSQ